ncbi:MAG: hypothetical protein ACYS47_10910, partial [Planctomycetota bacterium]
MRKFTLLTLLAVIAVPAFAQSDDAARDRADAVLAELRDFDDSLCGTWWFRLDRAEELFLACKLTVEIVRTEAGPVYRLTAHLGAGAGFGGLTERMVYHLDEKLSTIYGRETRG